MNVFKFKKNQMKVENTWFLLNMNKIWLNFCKIQKFYLHMFVTDFKENFLYWL